MRPLNSLSSLKAKVAVLVIGSVVLSTVAASSMTNLGLAPWFVVPSVVVVALGLTQVLGRGMTQPLRDMTAAAAAMDHGDFSHHVSSTARDEVGQLARAFNQMAAQLEAVDRQRLDVVAAVTEELRSPVPALRALLETLAAGVVRPTPAALGAALAQTDRLRRLLLALTDLTRLSAGEARLESEHVAMRPFLQDAVRDARQAGYTVQYDVRLDPFDLVVDADRARLMTLVGCLLDNAGRHSPEGRTVVVRAYCRDGHVVLETDDSGLPLDAEERLTVLDRFRPGSGPQAGDGLGLALARWVTDLLSGSLEVLEGRTRGSLVRASVPHVPVRRVGYKGAARPLLTDEAPATGEPAAGLHLVGDTEPQPSPDQPRVPAAAAIAAAEAATVAAAEVAARHMDPHRR
ncbi:MAG: HAMP domain-containing sensor histidine kinase [Nocardioidaceae bacterium]